MPGPCDNTRKGKKVYFLVPPGDSQMDFNCTQAFAQVLHRIRMNPNNPTRLVWQSGICSQSLDCAHTHRGTSQVISLVIKYCCYIISLAHGHRAPAGFVAAAITSQISLANKSYGCSSFISVTCDNGDIRIPALSI